MPIPTPPPEQLALIERELQAAEEGVDALHAARQHEEAIALLERACDEYLAEIEGLAADLGEPAAQALARYLETGRRASAQLVDTVHLLCGWPEGYRLEKATHTSRVDAGCPYCGRPWAEHAGDVALGCPREGCF